MIFEGTVMLGIFTGSPILQKSTKFIRVLFDLEMVIVS